MLDWVLCVRDGEFPRGIVVHMCACVCCDSERSKEAGLFYLPDLKRKIILFKGIGQPRSYASGYDGTVAGEHLHQCVWKPHFTSVYDTIPNTFYQCKCVVVLWIQDNLLDRSLFSGIVVSIEAPKFVETWVGRVWGRVRMRRVRRDGDIHGEREVGPWWRQCVGAIFE
jgi:hypothetical protein